MAIMGKYFFVLFLEMKWNTMMLNKVIWKEHSNIKIETKKQKVLGFFKNFAVFVMNATVAHVAWKIVDGDDFTKSLLLSKENKTNVVSVLTVFNMIC